MGSFISFLWPTNETSNTSIMDVESQQQVVMDYPYIMDNTPVFDFENPKQLHIDNNEEPYL